MIKFVQGNAAFVPISATKQFCQHFRVPVLKVKLPMTLQARVTCQLYGSVAVEMLLRPLRFKVLTGVATVTTRHATCSSLYLMSQNTVATH